LSFSWYDAAVLSQKIRRQAECAVEPLNRLFVTKALDINDESPDL
jgi:hypothetical protein